MHGRTNAIVPKGGVLHARILAGSFSRLPIAGFISSKGSQYHASTKKERPSPQQMFCRSIWVSRLLFSQGGLTTHRSTLRATYLYNQVSPLLPFLQFIYPSSALSSLSFHATQHLLVLSRPYCLKVKASLKFSLKQDTSLGLEWVLLLCLDLSTNSNFGRHCDDVWFFSTFKLKPLSFTEHYLPGLQLDEVLFPTCCRSLSF